MVAEETYAVSYPVAASLGGAPMLRRLSPRWLIPLTLVVLLLAACGDSADDSADTTLAPTTTVIETTTTAPPASTTAPTTTTAAPATTTVATLSVRPPEPSEPWDVLFLADRSDPISDTVAELYRQHAQDGLGVEVRVFADSVYPAVSDVLSHIRDERYPPLSDLVRQAEIIVVQTWPRGVIESEDADLCRNPDPAEPAPDTAAFTPEMLAVYREVLSEIYTEVWRLREGTATVLIGTDSYNPWATQQSEAGIAAECRIFHETLRDAQREVAEAHGAQWVSLYDLLHGPDHDLDPLELGHIGPTEQMPDIAYYVPNEIGAEMIADALAAAGLEPVTQP